ncbi:hypothetical protein GCM10010435_02880 [Winogradskya consettensis]|uniref:CBM6 domain-containing protein n=1 Tax=Winogradskya consettensis TaxID=113560 RepID=A0A919VJZ8_9ACTN|nr:DUF1996 domain-containing protein [Actinoplanes consettensis]GIM66019.1 hypothetical protein Aco04nite_00070 [Actinoplanes consettensis]
MRNTPAHVAPQDPVKKRRRITRITLASAVVAALGGSGIYIAAASADEVVVPGRVQAEAFTAQSGAQTEGTGDADGGKNVGWLSNGDWLKYDNVSITSADLSARIASQNTEGGSIELHLGTQTGTLLATFPVASTGGWQKWKTVTARAASAPTGKQTVFAVMKSASRSDFVNVNWFTFGSAAAPSPSTSATTKPSTSPSASPSPSASAGTPSGDGWVTMDQAAWQKQLADFNALKQNTNVPSNNVRVAEFNASCTLSHSAKDDAIVFPNMPGASHMHTFLGNNSTDAATTLQSLMANTSSSCKPADDHSAYWIPQLQEADGTPVELEGVTVYYGSRLKDTTKTMPFPQGFRMIQGDAKKQTDTPDGAPGQFWCAGAGGQTGRSTDGNWPVCANTANLTFQLTFPDCWDGVHLDSPDHKSHVGPTGPDGTCASGKFPVAIPSLSFVIGYKNHGSTAGMKLSSGNASSMHGDAFFAWENDALGSRVKNCIWQKAKCNSEGGF